MLLLRTSGIRLAAAAAAAGFRMAGTVDDRAGKALRILIEAHDREYIGEAVSQQEHALQAAQLAAQSGADEETVLAALFHDIGHLCALPGAEMMGHAGVKGHERIGAAYLRELGFSAKVAALVEAHVMVKRYLTFKDPGYYARLSDASRTTLRYQGGPMDAAEAAAFEGDPLFREKCLLRNWDEEAKVVGWQVPNVEYYRPIVIRHLQAQA